MSLPIMLLKRASAAGAGRAIGQGIISTLKGAKGVAKGAKGVVRAGSELGGGVAEALGAPVGAGKFLGGTATVGGGVYAGKKAKQKADQKINEMKYRRLVRQQQRY